MSKAILDDMLDTMTYEDCNMACTRAHHIFANKKAWANAKRSGAGRDIITKHTGLGASGRQVARGVGCKLVTVTNLVRPQARVHRA